MGKLVRFTLGGLLVVAGCTNDYEEFSFGDAGAGGSAGAGNVSGAGGAGNASGAGGGAGDCGTCPPGMVCENQRCRCTAATQCGSGADVECSGEGRCVCDGDQCRPGEVCEPGGNGPRCSCNGGQDCSNNQICCASGCASPWSSEENCGACGRACGAGQQCIAGNCVG
ncbi:MAG: hypothetical protein AMXMBFR56_18580 [Polyangiaceae bacterium]